jgi:outer membrane immunogenic protein
MLLHGKILTLQLALRRDSAIVGVRTTWGVEMKNLLIAVAALGLFAASGAKAADLPLRAPPPPPPPVPYFSWTGFYIGVNGGGGSANDSFSGTQTTIFGPTSFGGSGNFVGAVAGGQGGFNYEFPIHVVIGVEGDGDWANLGNALSACSTFSAGPFTGFPAGCATNNLTLNSFETVRGRLGYAFDTGSNWAPSALLYATGGWAWGQSSGNSTLTCLGVGCPAASLLFTGGGASFSDRENGWVAGAGFEWAIFQHWTARIEYLHLQFNNVSTNYSTTTTSNLGTSTATTHISSNDGVNVVRFGVNYLFNFGGLAYAGGY